jgi:hypothetical protein
MSISNSGGADILNKEWNTTTYTPAATRYLGFRKNGTELTSINSPGYARIAITLNTTNFPLTTTPVIANAVAFATPAATGTWLEADEVAIFDASTGGTARYTGLLDQPFTMVNGQVRSFAAGALRIRLI